MYHITITREDKVKATTQNWKQVYDTTDEAEAHGADSKYAYVDKVEDSIEETTLLDQRLEELDMESVIIAVNRISMTKPALKYDESPTHKTVKKENPHDSARA